jgi:Domain of unknown function (DUF4115)
MFYVAPRGTGDGHPLDPIGTPGTPSEPAARPPLADVREQADAIRAEAERQAAQIIRDAEDRADLLFKARLAYAERELDRLRSLRRNIGTLLESSVSALRVVEHMLPNDRAGSEESRSWMPDNMIARALAGRYRYAMIVALCLTIAGVLAGAAWYAALPDPAPAPAETTPRAGDIPEASPATREPDVALAPPAPSLTPAATTGASPAATLVSARADQPAALTVLLAAERQCWIRATIDDGRVIERLLEPDQELVVTARESVVLRIGDAGALSTTINGKPAQRFGGPGQVITRQITLQNYSRWLLGLS